MAEQTAISFEVFPAKEGVAENKMWHAVNEMGKFAPEFVSVTFGAGGSGYVRSIRAIKGLLDNTNVNIAAHLTCAGASKSEIDKLAQMWWDLGIRKIVALRGDIPIINNPNRSESDSYPDSVSLISGLSAIAPFEIYVAAYPEPHPESKSLAADLDYLKQKIDAGATAAITQYFFEPEMFLRFRDRCVQSGIHQPIIPGILPVSNFGNVVAFSERCGATVPQWMHQQFANLDHDANVASLVAAANACCLCRELQREGVNNFHIYTMNRAELPSAICRCISFSSIIRKSA